MKNNHLLLPSGLYDRLPPEARKESVIVMRLLDSFEGFGYRQVNPPLLEFEASLFTGRGEAMADRTFRVLDPMSQSMMGFRADMTLQIARIAASRLSPEPRPLRLCYSGPVLQSKPEALQNERQLTQAGIELIGEKSALTDAEAIIVAGESLAGLRLKGISIDINLFGLLTELCPEAAHNAELRARISEAVAMKETGALALLPLASAPMLATLLDAAGPADAALGVMTRLGLPQVTWLGDVVRRVQGACPYLELTLDPLDHRGFDYHQGMSFSLFAGGLRHELGRGGRYKAGDEHATGFTIYVTHLLELVEAPPERRRILIGDATKPEASRRLRAEGWATVLAPGDATRKEAERLGCPYILEQGKIETI